MEEVYLKFKKCVLGVFGDCLSKREKPWKYSEVIIGEGKINDFTFESEKLLIYKRTIFQMLNILGVLSSDKVYYDSLKFDEAGYAWTDLNLHVEMLVAMANALNMIEFKKDKLEWTEEDKKNPELVCTIKR